MVRPFFLLPLLACLLSAPPASHAQMKGQGTQRSYSLEGTVRSADSEVAVEQIRVDLMAGQELAVATVLTDGGGRFVFREVLSGIYTVVVKDPAYQPASVRVDLTFTSRSDVILHVRKVATEKPATPGPTVSAHELSMPEKARAAVQEGRQQLYGRKDPQGSLAEFGSAIQAAPDYYEAYYERAMANWQLGRIAVAQQDLRASIKLSGQKFGQADVALGAILTDQQKFADAEEFLRRGVELQPGSWMAQFQLGRALLGMNRLEEAQKCASHARTLRPDHPPVYRLLANIHSQMHDQPALLEDLNAYIRLDPDSPAGLKAKQMREDVLHSLAQAQPVAAAPTKP